jgi:hypothetical protein
MSTHFGVTNTLRRISKLFYWSSMRADVRCCNSCQRAKQAQNSRLGLHSSKVLQILLEKILINYVDPIFRSRKGNIALLIGVDEFSKLLSLCPARKLSSDAELSFLVKRVSPAMEFPICCLTQCDRIQIKHVLQSLLFMGIRHVTTSPHYPQASQAEWFNCSLIGDPTIYHNSQHTHWDEFLPSLSISFNSVWRESCPVVSGQDAEQFRVTQVTSVRSEDRWGSRRSEISWRKS